MENSRQTPPARPPSATEAAAHFVAQGPPGAQPPQRPARAVRGGQPMVLSAIPPMYANRFEVEPADHDLSIRFQQRDPHLDRMIEAAKQGDAYGSLGLESQLPQSIVVMSQSGAEELYAALGKALGK